MTMTVADGDECPTTPSKSLERTSAAMLSSVSSRSASDAANNSSSSRIGALLSNKMDALPRSVQFMSLASCVFFFFGIHNVLQESMMKTEGFTFGVMLGWMEVLGVTLCSALERSRLPCIGNGESHRKRSAPWQAYPLLTLCLLLSSSLASWSLDYINFPTKVVFRSCKLLPTMAMAYIMGNAARFTAVEIGSAMAVCAGLITFAAGDWSLSKPQFHPFGLTLVTASVFADAVLPNAQERLFRTYDASRSEVMFFTNIYTLMVQTVSALLSGDMIGMLHFIMGKPPAQEVNYFYKFMGATNATTAAVADEIDATTETASGEIRQTFLLCIVAYILISWVAVSAHTAVVRKFGGVAAVFVGTARKGMTLILSFALFPKESNWRYLVGASLVLGGLAVASLEKQRNKRSLEAKTFRTKNSDIDEQASLLNLRSEEHLSENNRDLQQRAKIDLEVALPSLSQSTHSSGPERRR